MNWSLNKKRLRNPRNVRKNFDNWKKCLGF